MNILLFIGLAVGGLCIFLLMLWVADWFINKLPDDEKLGTKKEKRKNEKSK